MNLIFKKFLKDPKHIGAIVESSISSAKKVASLINNTSTENIVEIGGGTGRLSKFIENKNLSIVERDAEFTQILKDNYPNSKIINKCGIEFLNNYPNRYGLFTSIPLIENKTKIELTKVINKHIEKNQLEWFIILGYKFFNQLKGINFKNQDRHLVLNNLPPAFIWHYY